MSYRTYWADIIKGKQQGLFPTLLKALFVIPSLLFQAAVYCRNRAYDRGYFSQYRSRAPVTISIGNIAVGGTGKTPMTLKLAQEFYPAIPIAILSRGYHSFAERLPHPVILCSGEGPLYTAAGCGDEPFLFAANLPQALVIVGRNRSASAELAEKLGAKILLLDDGLQHRRLFRNFDIVMINGEDPFGHDAFLPRGFLRDSVYSLTRASLILCNHVQSSAHYKELQEQLAPYSSAPLVGLKAEVKQVWELNKRMRVTLKNKKVGVLCGIAHPEQFEKTVRSEGAVVVVSHFLPDHSEIVAQEWLDFAKRCKELGIDYIVCTEKDYVKFPQIETALPIVWVQMELVITEGEEHWKKFIERVRALL